MTNALPADHVGRERLLAELDTTFFVEAGAGTGKTTALVSRIVELVARGRLRMERLAAITFTEAAAAELRDRLRQDLERAALGRTDAAQRAHCALAAREVDLAAVQTIHSFAGALLRTFPLEAGLPPNFSMLDDLEQERQFDDRYRAWLYDQVPDESVPERRAAVRRVLALGMSPEQLRDLATRLQDYRDLLLPNTVWPRSPTAPPPMVQPPEPVELAQRWGARLVALADEAEPEAYERDDKLAVELRRVRTIAERMRATDDADDALRLLIECAPNHWGGSQNAWPPGRCRALKEILKECARELYAAIGDHRAAALADLLAQLRDFTLAFADDRRQAGTATFHDLLTWARDLLRDHAQVRRRAQDRFDRVFVDEFQDTDPLQVEIAWFLSSDPDQIDRRDWRTLRLVPGKLFIVGDPKQSIYRFRRADIGIYEQVYGRLEHASDRVVLSQSFRSPAPLVDWFNHHFTDDLQPVSGVQPAYQALDARPADGFPDASVHRMGTRIDAASERWQAEASSVAQVAHALVRGATPWRVTDRGTPDARVARFSDICVLIPSRTNLRRLERAFQVADVPYRIESGWLVLQTQEVRDLLACLRAIDDPSDQVALVAALRSPAFGCSDVELLRWVDAGDRFDYERPGGDRASPVRAAFESLRALHARRMDEPPAALIERFIHERLLAVQAFGGTHPRDALRRLRYVVAQARALDSAGQHTLRGLCDWLESRQREQYYDAESVVPDADEDAVRFLTVHGSKGLEFPIVILTGLSVATSRAGPQSVDLVPDYRSDVLHIRCGEFSTGGYVRDTEKTMYEAEQRRLLYVATTRARDHLVLSLFHGKDACHATRIVGRLAHAPHLAHELIPQPIVVWPSAPPLNGRALSADEQRASEAAWLAQRTEVIERQARQTVVAPSQVDHPADPPPVPDPNAVVVRRGRPGRGSSALGRAVHAVLQTIDLATLADLDALAALAAADEGIPDLVRTVADYVRHAAASGPVQHALASQRYWREVPVAMLRSDDSIVEGAIDLLYESPDHRLTIVDYKTDHILLSDLAARAETYRAQGALYAEVLEHVTRQHVQSVQFVFAALEGRVVEHVN